jgi:hypothetical protein
MTTNRTSTFSWKAIAGITQTDLENDIDHILRQTQEQLALEFMSFVEKVSK